MKSSQQEVGQLLLNQSDSKAIVLASEAVEWDHSEPAEDSPADTPGCKSIFDITKTKRWTQRGRHGASPVQSDHPPFSNVAEIGHELPSLASVLDATQTAPYLRL